MMGGNLEDTAPYLVCMACVVEQQFDVQTGIRAAAELRRTQLSKLAATQMTRWAPHHLADPCLRERVSKLHARAVHAFAVAQNRTSGCRKRHAAAGMAKTRVTGCDALPGLLAACGEQGIGQAVIRCQLAAGAVGLIRSARWAWSRAGSSAAAFRN